MGKRARTECNSDYESIAKKFRKLERKLLRARRKDRDREPRRRSTSSSSSSSSKSSSSGSWCSRSSCSQGESSPLPLLPPTYAGDVPAVHYEPRPSTSAAPVDPLPSYQRPPPLPTPPAPAPPPPLRDLAPTPPPQLDEPHLQVDGLPTSAEISVVPNVLDESLLQLLGDDPSQIKTYSKDIQSDLAIRLQHIATTGLSKEVRKELQDKHLPPGNCTLIDAPILNPEVKAAVSDTVLKRDQGIEQKQKQITSSVSCIAEALTLLLSSETPDASLITLLMDATRREISGYLYEKKRYCN